MHCLWVLSGKQIDHSQGRKEKEKNKNKNKRKWKRECLALLVQLDSMDCMLRHTV